MSKIIQAIGNLGIERDPTKSTNINVEKTVDLDAILGNEPPADEPPADEPPADEPPADEPPADEPPADEPPADEPPADEPPADEPPTEDFEDDIVDLEKPPADEPPADDDKGGEEVDFIKIGDKKVDVETVENELKRLSQIEQAIINDEFLLGFIKHYDGGGDPLDYIAAKKVDYSNVSNFDLLKDNWYSENADLSDAVKTKLFAKEMKQKYGYDVETGTIDDTSDEDPDILKAMMERDANKVRAAKMDLQKKFQTKIRENGLLNQSGGIDDSERIKEHTDKINNHTQTKELSESGIIPVEIDGKKLGIKVKDAQSIINMAIDDDSFFNLFGIDEEGITEKTDLTKFYKVAAMAVDPAAYDKKLISIGRTLERRERMSGGKNLLNDGSVQDRNIAPKKENRKRELLKAFKEHGVHYTT